MRFLESTSDAILNRSPEELIGALLIAAVVGIAVAGLYALGRQKSSPSPTFVGGLGLAAGASCMALAAGYIEYAGTNGIPGAGGNHLEPSRSLPVGPGQATAPPPWSLAGAGWSTGLHVVAAADENRDGRLTPEEVARLMREADTDGDGSVDFRDIDRLIAGRFRAPYQPFGPTVSQPNDRGGGDRPPGNGRTSVPESPNPPRSIERGTLP